MKKVGIVLAEARQKRRISLEDVSAHTKIRLDYLSAIEQNRFEVLPPQAYVKGFLRSYAMYLGMDASTILALLRRDFKVGKKGQIIPREFLKPGSRKRTFFTPKLTAMVGVVIVAVMVASFAGLQWYRLQQPPALTVTSPEEQAVVGKTVVVTGQTNNDAVVSVNANPVSLTAEGTFRTEVFFSETGTHTVTVKAEDRKQRATTIQRTVEVRE